MILEKFLRNSLKKVTTLGESGEIPHFCYFGTHLYAESINALSNQGSVMCLLSILNQ